MSSYMALYAYMVFGFVRRFLYVSLYQIYGYRRMSYFLMSWEKNHIWYTHNMNINVLVIFVLGYEHIFDTRCNQSYNNDTKAPYFILHYCRCFIFIVKVLKCFVCKQKHCHYFFQMWSWQKNKEKNGSIRILIGRRFFSNIIS